MCTDEHQALTLLLLLCLHSRLISGTQYVKELYAPRMGASCCVEHHCQLAFSFQFAYSQAYNFNCRVGFLVANDDTCLG